jgi:hypothetical protein
MAQSNLTRWIEEAEARRFNAEATANCNFATTESYYLHLGKAIAKVPSWFHDSVSCNSVATMSSQVLARLRHPLTAASH